MSSVDGDIVFDSTPGRRTIPAIEGPLTLSGHVCLLAHACCQPPAPCKLSARPSAPCALPPLVGLFTRAAHHINAKEVTVTVAAAMQRQHSLAPGPIAGDCRHLLDLPVLLVSRHVLGRLPHEDRAAFALTCKNSSALVNVSVQQLQLTDRHLKAPRAPGGTAAADPQVSCSRLQTSRKGASGSTQPGPAPTYSSLCCWLLWGRGSRSGRTRSPGQARLLHPQPPTYSLRVNMG